ncbi:anti-sigma-F factor Fin [Paraliobacillus quinghaiensis]|uniref:Anti-sigma-F factor Fin n=1 Tax=Paraliobacillus quinghaiensis TaxID=470815 RepID=A0A917WWW1_9BACI|nr:anti-sigma-F factor Fin family protein [Paraliobacillus quinghaiensis]GGM36700.1 anti-sigma-F factor Fin [Paraliobacillus quinghaiensis]
MAIKYKCHHCNHILGTLDHQYVETNALGLQHLSVEDRKEMIQYLSNGDIEIKTICEDCQDTLEQNPDYHALDSFIQ